MSESASIEYHSEIPGNPYSTIFTFIVEFRESRMPVEAQFQDAAKRTLRDDVSERQAVEAAIREEVERVPDSKDWTVTIAASPISVDVNRILELGLTEAETGK